MEGRWRTWAGQRALRSFWRAGPRMDCGRMQLRFWPGRMHRRRLCGSRGCGPVCAGSDDQPGVRSTVLTRRMIKEGTASMSNDSAISDWTSASTCVGLWGEYGSGEDESCTCLQDEERRVLCGELLHDLGHLNAWCSPGCPEVDEGYPFQVL